MESCEDCGFVWDDVALGEIGHRVGDGAGAIAQLLEDHAPLAGARPAPERWSMLEYAAHARDVLLMMRDRLVVGLVEDEPGFKPMYSDERVRFGLYRGDDASTVADELVMAAGLFGRTFAAIDPAQLGRSVQYGYPGPARRTLLWLGQQIVHEVEHHRDDIAENARLLGSTG